MKNLKVGRVKTLKNGEITGADSFAVHPILQTIAISTQENLILIEENDVKKRISWKNERRGVEIASLTFRTDGNQIVAILSDGRALVIDDDDILELEISESPEKFEFSAEWSSDEQILALADNSNFYLTDSSLVPFVERSLNFSENEQKSTSVNVGWGSETTQFRGSAGKLKPGEKIEKEREKMEQHSKRTEIHWRQDGEIVAVSYFSEISELRHLTIFDRNGEPLNSMNIRNLYLSKSFSFKPNANLLVSAILQKNSDDKLIFYERNGETRNSYVVKYSEVSRNSDESNILRKIDKIEWNSIGTILAIQMTIGDKTTLEFWHLSNYEFTRKIHWKFAKIEKIQWKWSISDSQVIDLLLYDSAQFFQISIGLSSSFSDEILQNCVVATDEMRMYSLCRKVVPPPMCDYSIKCLDEIVDYTTTKGLIHVITAERKILAFSQNTEDYKFNNDRVAISSNIPAEISNGIICGFVYDEPTESYVIWTVTNGKHQISRVGGEFEIVHEDDNIGWIGINPENQSIEFATNEGRFFDLKTKTELFKVDNFEAIEVHFSMNHHILLLDNSLLFIDSQRVPHDAVSILTRGSDILLIDFDNKLRFIDILSSSKPSDDVRDVEAGCELVACSPESANVILQAARGNLETIQPRRYVMAETEELLNQKKYISAFKWMKKHRIDMSFALKFKGADLENDIDFWLKNSKNSQILEQLVVSCTENSEDEEGNSLCRKIIEKIENFENFEEKTEFFPLFLTAFLRSKPARINDALMEVKKHSEGIKTRKDVFTRHSLHHISFFVPAKELFNCALSTYDLRLAQQVAEASNYDPKEYLPVLNSLNRIQNPLEQKFRINVTRESWIDAIKSLLELDLTEPSEGSDKWFSEAKDIIQRESLHQKTLCLLNPDDKRYRNACHLYASELERKFQWSEAALFYELAEDVEKTLKCWEMSRDVDRLEASARRFHVAPDKLRIHAMKMTATLREARMPRELVKAMRLAGTGRMQILQVLCDSNDWSEAWKMTEDDKEKDLLKKSILTRKEQLDSEFEAKKLDFEKFKKRLGEVREKKLRRVEQFAAGEVEDLRDDISVVSSIVSSRSGSSKVSMASTVRRKKQIEKKKSSLKEGGEYEDSALLNALAEIFKWTENYGNELAQLIPVLMVVGYFGNAINMKTSYDEFSQKLQKSKSGIWPEVLSIQHLPGPLYALFDPNQEPSPIPMPPIFRLEPELFPPSSTFSSVFP